MKKLRIVFYLLVSILIINLANCTTIKTVSGQTTDVLTREIAEKFEVKLAAGSYHSLLLKDNGTVEEFGESPSLDSWKDIIQVGAGNCFSVGLKKDGKLVSAGHAGGSYFDHDISDIYEWTDIVQIAVGDTHVIGLKSDGTVVATGNNDRGQLNVSSWDDIVKIDADYYRTVGVKSDGTVVISGTKLSGEVDDVSEWNDIVDIAVGNNTGVVGLKSDGTLIATKGINVAELKNVVDIQIRGNQVIALHSDGTVSIVGKSYGDTFSVSNWKDIVAISTAENHMIALKSDGTVVATGRNLYGEGSTVISKKVRSLDFQMGYSSHFGIYLYEDGTVSLLGSLISNMEEANSWTNMVQVQAGNSHVVGLRSDGTVLAVGSNYNGQTKVEGWVDIVEVSTGYNHTVGLRSDGTVLATGDNGSGQCDVLNWTDVVAIEAGNDYTLGLRSDGTVLFSGSIYNNNVSQWSDIVAISGGMALPIGLKSDGKIVPSNTLDGSNFISVSQGYDHFGGGNYVVGLKNNNTIVYQGKNIDLIGIEQHANIKKVYTAPSQGIGAIDYDGNTIYEKIPSNMQIKPAYAQRELSTPDYIVKPGDKVSINFEKSLFYYIHKPQLVINDNIYKFHKVNENQYTLSYNVSPKDIGTVSASTEGISDLFSNVLVAESLFKVIPLKSIKSNKEMALSGEEIVLTLEFYEPVKPNFRISLEVNGLAGTPQFVNEVAESNGTIYTITCPVSSNSTFGPVGVRLHNVIDLNSVVYDTFVEENIFYKVISHQDLNQDDVIDEKDLEIIQEYYNVSAKDQNWRSHYDFNEDSIIDLYDIVLITNQLK